jgi:hypothetical protein
MSLVYGVTDGMPACPGPAGSSEPGHRSVRLSVADALRSRFPLRSQPGARPRATSVAEALRARFPGEPQSALAEITRPTLPRRIRNMSVSARPADPSASPELLLRILDGLQRL